MPAGSTIDEVTRLRHIIETQRLINSVSLDGDELMRVVSERAQAITLADGATVELAEGDHMVCRAACGSAAPFLGTTLKMTSSLSGRCVRLGIPLRCDDSETDVRVDCEAGRTINVRSMIVVPLLKLDVPVGVLNVVSNRPNQFDDTDTDILQEMAGFIADSLTHASAHRRETHMALRDKLTRLPNRHLLTECLEHACVRSEREGTPLAVFLINLDGLKRVNDWHGHVAGDDVLKMVASHLAAAIRSGDTLARLGGDEFALVCEGATESDVYVIVDRISSAVRTVAAVTPEYSDVAASIGLAWRREGCSTPDELLAAAGASMCRAKRAGKTAAGA